MGAKNKRSRNGQPTIKTQSRSRSPNSADIGPSTKIINPAFFDSGPSSAVPLSANQAQGQTSQTWKSEETIEREKFDHIRQRVQHFAPEQFKTRAKPSNRRAEIVPQTFQEYKLYLHETGIEQVKKKLALMEARQKTKSLPLIMPAFNGKIFETNRSSVLGQSSVWSQEFQPSYEHPTAAWPCRKELHEDGEKRENVHAPTRCGRFLPALRHPETGAYMQQYPLDQVGPIRSQGPTPMECIAGNSEFDMDASFEGDGRKLLGSDLMKDLGDQQLPFVPEWLAEKRNKHMIASAEFYQQESAFEGW